MRSLSGRDFAADLVEEIENEADLVYRTGLFRARGVQHRETLAVRMQVKVVGARAEVGELAGRPELWLIGMEGRSHRTPWPAEPT
jgi:hypothetical protein